MTTSKPVDTSNSITKGYWIVFATVNENADFIKYTSLVEPLITSHGGRTLATGDVSVVVQGSVPGRPYLIEFPSYADAQACFHSQAYQEVISLRSESTGLKIFIVEGLPPSIST